jgi:hypothetical protein
MVDRECNETLGRIIQKPISFDAKHIGSFLHKGIEGLRQFGFRTGTHND